MEIRVGINNSCYFPSDNGSDSVINIASAGYTLGRPDFNVSLTYTDSSYIGFYELEYVEEGICHIESGGKTYTATEGEFFFINKGIPRILSTERDSPVKKYFLNVKGALADGIIKGYGINDAILILKSNVKEYFSKILGALGEADSYTVEVEGKIAVILTGMFHRIYTDKLAVEAEKIRLECSAEDIMRYLDMNVGKKFSIEEMCDYFYISSATLWRIFKAKYNVTPLEHLQKKRMEKAKYYLLKTKYPISTIHEKIGLGDPKYFSKLFKKETGMTPRQFRQTFYGIVNVTGKVISDAKTELAKRKIGNSLNIEHYRYVKNKTRDQGTAKRTADNKTGSE